MDINPLKIGLFVPRYYYAGGGSILYARRLAEELALRGHRVDVVVDAFEGPISDDLVEIPGCTLRSVRRQPRVESWADRKLSLEARRGCYGLGRWLHRKGSTRLTALGPWCETLSDPAYYQEWERLILMNSGNSSWALQMDEALRKDPKLRALALPLFHPYEEAAGYPVQKSLHAAFAAVGTLTHFEKDFLLSKGWVGDRIHTLGAGSDPLDPAPDPQAFRREYEIPEAAPLILFLSRKIHNKGLPMLVEAMDRVWDACPEARLALLGFSQHPPEWESAMLENSRHSFARARSLRLDDVDDPTREEALAACTVLAVPSVSDSFGIVYLDAWRMGRPVIACSRTCFSSVAEDGKDALLIPFGNVAALAQALLRLVEQPELAKELGRRGQQKWEAHYQWPQVAEKVEQVLLTIDPT